MYNQQPQQIADKAMLSRLNKFVAPPTNTFLASAEKVLEPIWCDVPKSETIEIGDFVTDGEPDYPIVGEVIATIYTPDELTEVVVRAPYVGDIELKIEDVRKI